MCVCALWSVGKIWWQMTLHILPARVLYPCSLPSFLLKQQDFQKELSEPVRQARSAVSKEEGLCAKKCLRPIVAGCWKNQMGRNTKKLWEPIGDMADTICLWSGLRTNKSEFFPICNGMNMASDRLHHWWQIELGLGSWSTAVSCFVSSSSDWHSFKQKVGTESGKALIQLDSMVMLILKQQWFCLQPADGSHSLHITIYIHIYIRYTYFIYSHLQVPSPVSAFAAQNVGAVWRRLRLRTPGGTPGPGNVRYVFRFVFH